MNDPEISIIVPIFNEEQSLSQLLKELDTTCDSLEKSVEILCIDDASTDTTSTVLQALQKTYKNMRAYRLQQNSGKGGAWQVGIKEAKSNTIVTIDSDLQDVASEIPNLLAVYEEGYDMVIGWKKIRQDSRKRCMASRVFNCLARLVSGSSLHDMNSGLKVFRKSVVENIQLTNRWYRLLSLYFIEQGYRVREHPVIHRSRKYGESRFYFSHRLRSFVDIAIGAWKRPVFASAPPAYSALECEASIS